jgi:16S rRNA (adenine1518-N6/adenine1519-N6)-dimethyltransferase
MSTTKRPRARKALGQHFLVNRSVVHKTVELLRLEGVSTIVEIGPGHGALTGALLETGKHVVAVEPDARMVNHLQGELGGDRLEIIHDDVLNLAASELIGGSRSKAVLAGNLPYNLSGPILGWIFGSAEHWHQVVVMLQLEVARRLVAPPSTRDFGPLAVACALKFEARKRFLVKASSFKPPPQVTSAVVELVPVPRPPVRVDDADAFMNLVHALFAHRRKNMRNNLRLQGRLDGEQLERLFRTAGLDGSRRAEQLTWPGLERLYGAYAAMT